MNLSLEPDVKLINCTYNHIKYNFIIFLNMNTNLLIAGAYLINILLVSFFILLIRNLVLRVSTKHNSEL